MKYPIELKKYISEVASNMRAGFFLGEYAMTIAYSDDRKPDESEEVAATISTDTRYLNFKLTIHPHILDLWVKGEKKKINEILVHEFSHLLIEPIYEVAVRGVNPKESEFLEDIRERQTQRITNVIFPLLKFKYEIKKSRKRKRK